MWTKLLIGIGLSVVLVNGLVLAEDYRVGTVYEDGLGEISVVVELPYGVTEPDASNFKLLIEGKKVATASEVRTFLDSGKELGWFLCVDVSGTMAGAPLQDTKQALHTFLHDRQALHVALMTFGTTINPQLDFQASRDALTLTRALDSLKAERGKGETRLYQAVHEALDYYAAEETKSDSLPKRKRILVISDGKDEGSSVGAEGVIKRSNTLSIPIDAVGRSKIEDQYIESLRHLAESTDGRFVHAQHEVVSLTDALLRMYRELMETQTVVAYFKYEPDIESRLTEVVVELQQPGKPALSDGAAAKILLPQTKTEPEPIPIPQERIIPEWLIWLLAAGLAALLTGVVVIISRKKPETERIFEPEGGEPESSVPPSQPALSEEKVRKERRTKVGGYFPPPEPERPAAILVGVVGALQDQQFSVEKELFRIGASPENDLCLTGDEYVSGQHAYLCYEHGSLLLFDNHSRNGTFVNESRLGASPMIITVGDRIRVGDSTFEVVTGPSS